MSELTVGTVYVGVVAILLSFLVRCIRNFGETAARKPCAEDSPYIYVYCVEHSEEETGICCRFRIERAERGYRAYILRPPDYAGRPQSFRLTHRLEDGKGVYVCWNSPIDSPESAEAVARLWTEKTGEYIRSGQRF